MSAKTPADAPSVLPHGSAVEGWGVREVPSQASRRPTVTESRPLDDIEALDFETVLHAYCWTCYPDIVPGALARCGHVKVGDHVEDPPEQDRCVVCVALLDVNPLCPRCAP